VFTQLKAYTNCALLRLLQSPVGDYLASWPLEMGSGFGDRLTAGEQAMVSLPSRYVLFVSTIEVRKNHRLLVRVWQRLLQRHGANLVPNLVFVAEGRLVGSDCLLADLEASGYLNGKVILLPSLSDAELQQAYRSCLFTVFRVSARVGIADCGKLGAREVLRSLQPRIDPEAGGDLIDYFDHPERR